MLLLCTNTFFLALPVTCRVTQNFYRGVDEDGCSNPDVIDYGKCAGGCGRLPEECCFKSNATLTTVPFQCSDGSVTMREVSRIHVTLSTAPLFFSDGSVTFRAVKGLEKLPAEKIIL